jgi:hypothetical protein
MHPTYNARQCNTNDNEGDANVAIDMFDGLNGVKIDEDNSERHTAKQPQDDTVRDIYLDIYIYIYTSIEIDVVHIHGCTYIYVSLTRGDCITKIRLPGMAYDYRDAIGQNSRRRARAMSMGGRQPSRDERRGWIQIDEWGVIMY